MVIAYTLGIAMITVLLVVILISLTVNTINNTVSRNKESTKKIYNEVKLVTMLTVLLMVCIPAKNYYKLMESVKDTHKLHDMVIQMYSNDPSEVADKIEKYRDMFTDKGFMGIDAKDNVYNILDRYTKMSKPTNKVKVLDSFPTPDNIYIYFTITTKEGEVQHRTAIMNKGLTRINSYEEFIQIPAS